MVKAATQKSILDRAPDGDNVPFADVEVRRTGNDDERWVALFGFRGVGRQRRGW